MSLFARIHRMGNRPTLRTIPCLMKAPTMGSSPMRKARKRRSRRRSAMATPWRRLQMITIDAIAKAQADDANKGKYLDPDMYDQHIEQLNSFIEKFDEGEGKENDVTFKAIASNLDWNSTEEVKAFAGHCNKKGLDGADDVLAFLYFQHQDDEEKFDKIIADMK